MIDITNEELKYLKDEKYDINSDFISFLKEFNDIFNNDEIDEENKIYNIHKEKNYLKVWRKIKYLMRKKLKL